MLKMLWLTLKEPRILLQITLLSKSIIRKWFVILTLITSIPLLWQYHHAIQRFESDVHVLSSRIPDFEVNNNILKPLIESNSYAVSTDTTYLLYDIENIAKKDAVEKMAQSKLLSLVMTKTDYTLYGGGVALQHTSFSTANGTTNDHLRRLVTQLVSHNIVFIYLFVFFIGVISAGISLAFQIWLYSIASHMVFLLLNRVVRFDHLFRTSLFVAFLPITCVALFETLGIATPFSTLIILIYVVTTQVYILKDIPNTK